MNLCFDQSLGLGYKSNSQKIRVMSESWVNDNIFCPVCGNARISKLENNRPVADFQCPSCGEIFELKSKDGRIGRKISDGAYDTMISRITSMTNLANVFVKSFFIDFPIFFWKKGALN